MCGSREDFESLTVELGPIKFYVKPHPLLIPLKCILTPLILKTKLFCTTRYNGLSYPGVSNVQLDTMASHILEYLMYN